MSITGFSAIWSLTPGLQNGIGNHDPGLQFCCREKNEKCMGSTHQKHSGIPQRDEKPHGLSEGTTIQNGLWGKREVVSVSILWSFNWVTKRHLLRKARQHMFESISDQCRNRLGMSVRKWQQVVFGEESMAGTMECRLWERDILFLESCKRKYPKPVRKGWERGLGNIDETGGILWNNW